RFSGPKTSIICSPMTSLKTSIKTITYLSDIGCLEIQGASLLFLSGDKDIEMRARIVVLFYKQQNGCIKREQIKQSSNTEFS
ncbi:hypothetical protein BGK51_24120, partial [Shigella sp. FC569]